MQFGKSILKGVKWTSVSTVGVALASLVRISILTRFLNKEDFGLMAIVVFVLGVLNLFTDMGLTSAIFHKQNISRKEYASLYWVNLFFGISLYGFIFLLSPYIASFYNEPQLTELILLMAISIVFASIRIASNNTIYYYTTTEANYLATTSNERPKPQSPKRGLAAFWALAL